MSKNKVISKVSLCGIIVSLFLSLLLSQTQYLNAYAKIKSITQDEAVAWIKAQEGSAVDYDGVYGVQCVDLIKRYYNYFGAKPSKGLAYEYMVNKVPAGFKRYKKTAKKKLTSIQPGDIVVWKKYALSKYSHYGHVGLAITGGTSSFEYLDYNGLSDNDPGTIRTAEYKKVSGIIRPTYAKDTTPANVTLQTKNIKATENSITLSWNEAKNAKSYDIYRKAPDESNATLYKSISGTAFTDENLIAGSQYSYQIYGINGKKKSKKAASISKWTLPSAVEIAARYDGTQTVVSLNGVSGVTEYQIYRSILGEDSYSKIGRVAVQKNMYTQSDYPVTYSDQRYEKGSSYDYKVIPVNASGSGAESNIVGIYTY